MPQQRKNKPNQGTLQQLASMVGSSAPSKLNFKTRAGGAKGENAKTKKINLGQTAPTNAQSDLISGHFNATKSPSGILVHTMNAQEIQNFESRVRLSPCLNFCILLEGEIEFTLNNIEYNFVATKTTPVAFATNITAPSDWSRRLRKDRNVKKVVVSLPYEWLKSRVQLGSSYKAQLKSLMRKHNHLFKWQPSKELRTIAQQLLNLSGIQNEDLILESKALEFIAHCLKQVDPDGSSMREQAPISGAERIQEYLESNVIENNSILKPNLEEISVSLGISTSGLQRKFKQQFNQTIYNYVRDRKLEKAKEYLKHQNASIGEAAYRAGYKHPPNFSKAFKLAFNITPGDFIREFQR
jgi:AraC-like DNA-binding protein